LIEIDQLEGTFYEYMHYLGQADEDWQREVLEFYVPHFAHCQRVLDVGCGHGQFIEILNTRGGTAEGIDLDARMVRICREKGLDVVRTDVFKHLPQQRGRFDGIFSSNVIEHLSAEDALRFVQMAFEALPPGGVFLIATPNPESLIVHLHEFWRDATHVRLYSRFLLEFLLSWAGFGDVHSGSNPKTIWTPSPALQAVPKLLEELSSRRESSHRGMALSGVSELTADKRKRPFWRRLAFSLRRRLARFLAQTVLFEEFAALFEEFAALSKELTALQRIDRALYESQSDLLTAPREIFAKGIKPFVEPEELG